MIKTAAEKPHVFQPNRYAEPTPRRIVFVVTRESVICSLLSNLERYLHKPNSMKHFLKIKTAAKHTFNSRSLLNLSLRCNATAILLTMAIVCSGCRALPTTDALTKSPGEWRRTELFFGQATDTGPPVDPQLWESFVTKDVSPVFPDGFTIFSGTGYWSDTAHKSHVEPSRVVIVWYPANQATAFDKNIEALASKYIHEFHQGSVLRADTKGVAVFYTSSSTREH